MLASPPQTCENRDLLTLWWAGGSRLTKQANDGQPRSPLGMGNPSASCLPCGDRQGDGAGKPSQWQGKAVAAGMEGTGKGHPGGQRKLDEAVMEGMGKGRLVVMEVSRKGHPRWGHGKAVPEGQRGLVAVIPGERRELGKAILGGWRDWGCHPGEDGVDW